MIWHDMIWYDMIWYDMIWGCCGMWASAFTWFCSDHVLIMIMSTGYAHVSDRRVEGHNLSCHRARTHIWTHAHTHTYTHTHFFPNRLIQRLSTMYSDALLPWIWFLTIYTIYLQWLSEGEMSGRYVFDIGQSLYEVGQSMVGMQALHSQRDFRFFNSYLSFKTS